VSSGPIDPERLAAFLDGLLPPDQHAEMVRQIAASPELLDVFASAARPRSNPFHPTSTSKHGTFTGRRRELEKLASLLRQTRSGNGTNVLLTGEPGSGKSSLLMKLKAVAEGRDEAAGRRTEEAKAQGKQKDAFRFLVVYTDIDPATTQHGLLSKIVAGLERGLETSEKTKAFLKDLLEFASRIEAFGIRLHETSRPVDEAQMERFADHLARTVEAVTGARRGVLHAQHEGVLLILDEADKASPDLRLGSFLKLLIERLRWRECERFMVAVGGLRGLQDVLRSGHNSALRLFEVIELQRMDALASMGIVVEGLKRASEEGDRVTIQPGALRQMVTMSDGLPHFMQQIAYSAFAVNKDDVIDEEDVEDGTYNPEGAVAALAMHYGWSDLSTRSDCWAVLKALASGPEAGIPVAALVQGTGATARKVRDAVQRLAEERLVVMQPGADEPVRLATHALRAWVRLEAARPPD
jgi:hypothetical protein